jgi:phosphohistidine phosphatase SixA/8-oxo-dGTP pyrophosphatase MutT (NUDIX family)
MEVLLVHRPRYDDWTFPKGKALGGEGARETAVREVEEETGFRGTLGAKLPSSSYRDRHGREKIVRYWTMRPESGSFEPHGEIDAIEWTPIADAGAKLSYERDIEVLRAVPPPLLVFRHAAAGDRDAWEGDDARRPLDKRGRKQAEALVDRLSGFEVDQILSSPLDRCVQSVEPLARARGLDVETSDELAEGVGAERVRGLLNDLAGEAALVCGHGPELVPIFGKVKKGETLVLEPTDGQLVELGRIRV